MTHTYTALGSSEEPHKVEDVLRYAAVGFQPSLSEGGRLTVVCRRGLQFTAASSRTWALFSSLRMRCSRLFTWYTVATRTMYVLRSTISGAYVPWSHFYFIVWVVRGASVMIRFLFCFICSRGILPLQSYWSLSCDHGLDFLRWVHVRKTTATRTTSQYVARLKTDLGTNRTSNQRIIPLAGHTLRSTW